MTPAVPAVALVTGLERKLFSLALAQPHDMLLTYQLHQPVKDFGALSQPQQCLLADLEVFGIARFDIGLVERVEPGSFSMLVTRKGVGQAPDLLFRQRA